MMSPASVLPSWFTSVTDVTLFTIDRPGVLSTGVVTVLICVGVWSLVAVAVLLMPPKLFEYSACETARLWAELASCRPPTAGRPGRIVVLM